MTIVSPSLLAANFLELESEMTKLNSIENLWIHLDIMDGHFVPNLTFGEVVIKSLKKITKHPLDAHFMVSNPEFYLEVAKSWGLHNFTFHVEAVTHLDRFISECKKNYPSVGISFNPSTPIESISPYLLEKVNIVLLMSVNPGFGGQNFIPNVLEKADQLQKIKKTLGLSFEIQIDGGVNDKNAEEIKKHGISNLVAGSFIFNETNKNYHQQINKLR